MNKIFVYSIVAILSIVLLVALVGFIRFNFTNGGDIIPGVNAPVVGTLSFEECVSMGGTIMESMPRQCRYNNQTVVETVPTEKPTVGTSPIMTKEEAYNIGIKSCIAKGDTMSNTGSYNPNSKTWWFDLTLLSAAKTCNPACVISEDTKTAEIKYRCTGAVLLSPPDTSVTTSLSSKKKWVWSKTVYADSIVLLPQKSGAFGITFGANNYANISTDCNSMSGQYAAGKNTLTFGPLMSTKMYCEGSQENVFVSDISKAESYTIQGEPATLEIKLSDGAIMYFK